MTKNEIINWLDKYDIPRYNINEDLTVDVEDDVYLYDRNITTIPFFFNEVKGNFDIGKNKLTSLKGCPKIVGKCLYVYENELTSLDYSPLEVKEDYFASDNPLIDISGINYVGNDILLRSVPLSTLKGFKGKFEREIYISGYNQEGEKVYVEGFEDLYVVTLLKIDVATLESRLLYNILENNAPIKNNKIKKKI